MRRVDEKNITCFKRFKLTQLNILQTSWNYSYPLFIFLLDERKQESG